MTGHDSIRQFGLKPGLEVGHIKNKVREAQQAGLIKDRDEAIRLAADLMEKVQSNH